MQARAIFWATLTTLTACASGEDRAAKSSPVPGYELRVGHSLSLDLVFVVNDTPAMAPMQALLAGVIPGLVERFRAPPCVTPSLEVLPASQQAPIGSLCPAGSLRRHAPLDVRVAVLSASLGGHGSDACPGQDRRGLPVPSGEVGQQGCGYQAPLEAWYRFLVDPTPPLTVTPNPQGPGDPAVVDGIDDVLLSQRADFLRPDSLVAIVNLSDENDCSVIDGMLPSTVCDEPELDDNDNPTGCRGERVGWPAGYVEGNFSNWKSSGGRVTGAPFPANHLALQQRANDHELRLFSGTPGCDDDPYSPTCTSCYTGAEGCKVGDAKTDPKALRCWNQKARFGTDFLYPLRRYSDGLSQAKVYDRNGYLVTNPLFDDLPYKRARAAGQPLGRARAELRNGQLIFFAIIVGVPWQDIARDASDLTRGYKPAAPAAEETGSIDWDLILGSPFALDKAQRSKPKDPLMDETNLPRSGVHPVTGETIGPGVSGGINGGERDTKGEALQPACAFREPAGQGEALAYPGTRFLQVARNFGANSIVASVCPAALDLARADHGYRPAFEALSERLSTQLSGVSGLCLEGPSRPERGAFKLIEARLLEGTATAEQVEACRRCELPGRTPVSEEFYDIRPTEPSSWLMEQNQSAYQRRYQCLCEVPPLSGDDDRICRTSLDALVLGAGSGWCVIDPAEAGAVWADRCGGGRLLRFAGDWRGVERVGVFLYPI